jgi:hypothetical protein
MKVTAENRTQHLTKTILERYPYNILLDGTGSVTGRFPSQGQGILPLTLRSQFSIGTDQRA